MRPLLVTDSLGAGYFLFQMNRQSICAQGIVGFFEQVQPQLINIENILKQVGDKLRMGRTIAKGV